MSSRESHSQARTTGPRKKTQKEPGSGKLTKTRAAKKEQDKAKPRKPSGRKADSGKDSGAQTKKTSAPRKQEKEDAEAKESGTISRKELLEKAFQRIKQRLESETDLSSATIGALEKLLKLDREIVEESEMPHEIRVLWQEVNGESSNEK